MTRTATPEQAARLTKHSLRSIFRILRAPTYRIFPDYLVFLLIPVVIAAYLVGGYYAILAPGKLYAAIVDEDWSLFWGEMSKFALILTVMVVIKVLRGVLRESATTCLRARLTTLLHHLYFGSPEQELTHGPPPYYRINTNTSIDNPDQRVVADARDLSASLFGIVTGGQAQGSDSGGLLEAFASLLFYSVKTRQRTGFYGVAIAYVWSILVSFVTVYVVNYTSPVVFQQEKLEANFRFAHAELRRCAEEVAFCRGAPFEHRKLDQNLKDAVSNSWIVIARHMLLNFVQYGFGYFVSLVMYLAIALAIRTKVFESSSFTFSASMSPGEKAQWIAQTGGVFIQLLFSFTMIIQLGTAVSGFVSNTERVGALLDTLTDGIPSSRAERDHSAAEPLIAQEDGILESVLYNTLADGITVRDLTIKPTASRKLGPFSLSVRRGQWVLLEGPTGSGKSSILRVVRGLWDSFSGVVQIPREQDAIMFVPQRPYISHGNLSLRQIMLYPHDSTGSQLETDKLMNALNTVGWEGVNSTHVLDVKDNWAAKLSPGEAQLLSAARVLLVRPAYAILDEPTSSLDVESEERVFRAMKAADISAFTVGHSRSLRRFHDRVFSVT